MSINCIPGAGWIVVGFIDTPMMELVVIDRQGRPADRLSARLRVSQLSTDALWRNAVLPGGQAAILRTPLDGASGRFGGRTDTVFTGRFSGFSITEDGGALVIDEGS